MDAEGVGGGVAGDLVVAGAAVMARRRKRRSISQRGWWVSKHRVVAWGLVKR